MLLRLSKELIRKNFSKLRAQSSAIEKAIDASAGSSEKIINEKISDQLISLRRVNLGKIQFKKRLYEISLDVERAISHGKICEMALTNPVRTELGDLLIAVDHILIDNITDNAKNKIIGGTCSIIQTKKESYAKKGLSSRQLYLMTQWPRFEYKGDSWEFKIFPDLCSFYLFVLDPSSKKRKTNLLSSSALSRLLGVGKNQLLNNIKGKIPLPNTNLLSVENNEVLPMSFASFLIQSLYLTVGSQSIELRNFIRKYFFQSMEEVEDCPATIQILNQATSPKNWFPNYMDQPEHDEKILGIRLKVLIKRIE